jgi:hypothetical protein
MGKSKLLACEKLLRNGQFYIIIPIIPQQRNYAYETKNTGSGSQPGAGGADIIATAVRPPTPQSG